MSVLLLRALYIVRRSFAVARGSLGLHHRVRAPTQPHERQETRGHGVGSLRRRLPLAQRARPLRLAHDLGEPQPVKLQGIHPAHASGGLLVRRAEFLLAPAFRKWKGDDLGQPWMGPDDTVYRGSDNGSPNPNAAEYARVWANGGVSGRRNSAVRVFKHVSV